MTQITTVKLENPITRKSGTDKIEIDSIDVRSPMAGDLRGVSLAEFGDLNISVILTILPRLSNPALTVPEAEGLSVRDLVRIGGALMGEDVTKKNTAGNDGTSPKP